jgi:lysyl-tRNA synthetase class 2
MTQRRWIQPSLLLVVAAAAADNSGGDQPQQIISPFDTSAGSTSEYGETGTVATTTNNYEILDLTYENVELVLDSMRHYLIQDGGNVIIDEIDGPIVKLQLQGNCGTCPSSTQTMKMGYVQ